MSRVCSQTPGESYETRGLAEQSILDRRVNSALNGQRTDRGYVVKGCNRCKGFHVMTAQQLDNRRRKRMARNKIK